MKDTYTIGATLTVEEACRIVKEHRHIVIGDEARALIVRCREYLDRKIESCREPLYGITTGFGSLCNISINADDLSQLQSNLVMSHACGVGERVSADIVRTVSYTHLTLPTIGG